MSNLNAVTKAAINEGKSRANVCTAVLAAGGDTPEVRAAYIIGRMVVSLGYSEGDARLCLDKAGSGAKGDAPKRDDKEEKAYGAARVSWDSVKRACGIAASVSKSAKKKGARAGALTAPKTGQDAGATDAPLSIPALAVPKVKGVEGIGAYAMTLAANVRKFRSTNAASFTGDDGAFYRDTFDAFIASIEARNVKA
jgi:hypothetical protein